jgi:hypothetical protein
MVEIGFNTQMISAEMFLMRNRVKLIVLSFVYKFPLDRAFQTEWASFSSYLRNVFFQKWFLRKGSSSPSIVRLALGNHLWGTRPFNLGRRHKKKEERNFFSLHLLNSIGKL